MPSPAPTTARGIQFTLTLVVALLLAGSNHAQRTRNLPSNGGVSTGSGNTPSSMGGPYSGEDTEAMDHMNAMRERARAVDRQKRMGEEASRLVALSAQYRERMQQHSIPTADDTRLLADIEKLARSVKDRMRGL